MSVCLFEHCLCCVVMCLWYIFLNCRCTFVRYEIIVFTSLSMVTRAADCTMHEWNCKVDICAYYNVVCACVCVCVCKRVFVCTVVCVFLRVWVERLCVYCRCNNMSYVCADCVVRTGYNLMRKFRYVWKYLCVCAFVFLSVCLYVCMFVLHGDVSLQQHVCNLY